MGILEFMGVQEEKDEDKERNAFFIGL